MIKVYGYLKIQSELVEKFSYAKRLYSVEFLGSWEMVLGNIFWVIITFIRRKIIFGLVFRL